jgi:hypothetical protein
MSRTIKRPEQENAFAFQQSDRMRQQKHRKKQEEKKRKREPVEQNATIKLRSKQRRFEEQLTELKRK